MGPDPTGLHQGDLVAEMSRDGQVMGDEQVGDSCPFLQVRQQVDDRCLDGYIEGRRGFITDHETRLGRNGSRDGDPLLLAAGEGMWIPRCGISLEPAEFKQFTHPATKCFPPGKTMNLERFPDDRPDAHPAVQGAAWILEDDLHSTTQPAKTSARGIKYRLSLEEDPS